MDAFVTVKLNPAEFDRLRDALREAHSHNLTVVRAAGHDVSLDVRTVRIARESAAAYGALLDRLTGREGL